MSPHEGVRTLLQRYARAADDRDIETLASLFTTDAIFAGTRGEQSLDQWLDAMRAPRTFPRSMHVNGDPLIEFDDDGQSAAVDTYAVVYQLGDVGAGQGDMTLGMQYIDRVVLQQGRWLFLRRDSRTLWMR